ncbi:hypothetical protein ACFL2Q_05120 [Thermodesulfobacteriota bacterium]
MSKIKIRFGEPEHGWLAVKMNVGDYSFEINVSDVPDPVRQLVIALYTALRGGESEIWWNEEPGGYYFVFQSQESDYSLIVDREEGTIRSRVLSVSGSFQQIVLPFWDFLDEFRSHAYSSPDWEDFPQRKFERLTELIHEIEGVLRKP